MEELPYRLLVLGAGPIGCELAQAFARFGSEVALLDKEPRVLMREEPDAATRVQKALQLDGVRFVGGVPIQPRRKRCARRRTPGVAGS